MNTKNIKSLNLVFNKVEEFSKEVYFEDFNFEIEVDLEENYLHLKFENKDICEEFKKFYSDNITKYFGDERYATYDLINN